MKSQGLIGRTVYTKDNTRALIVLDVVVASYPDEGVQPALICVGPEKELEVQFACDVKVALTKAEEYCLNQLYSKPFKG